MIIEFLQGYFVCVKERERERENAIAYACVACADRSVCSDRAAKILRLYD